MFSQKLAKVLKGKLEAVGDNRAETFSVAFLAYNRTDAAPVQTLIDPRTGEMTFDYAEELNYKAKNLDLYIYARKNSETESITNMTFSGHSQIADAFEK